MAKVRINKLPDGYKLDNGKLVESKNMGGATRSGDQKDYGLVSHPAEFHAGVSPFNPFSDVNSSLKAVPKDEATIEAEGGETALTDLNEDGKFELYNIVGPRHSSGGVPLNLPPQSFIYSDTRDMLFNKDEMLEMGIESKKKLSPAKISKRFPLNQYIGTMDDITSDKIAIDTAEYMMDKNKKKLSQLAFIQEAKKGFEEGVPSAAYPYLKLQGIDPIQFTQKVEGINEQEAKQKALAQMPLDQRQQVMALQNILQQVQQQDLQQAQAMPPQGPPQGVPPQGMPMPPQQGMMPPQGMTPPQQAAPPMGMPMQPPMQPPMAQAPMPTMRYGGEYQKGGSYELDLNIFNLGQCVGAGTCARNPGGGTETELAAFLGAEGTDEQNALFQAGLKAGIGARGGSGLGINLSGEVGLQNNMKDILKGSIDPTAFHKGKLKIGYADTPLYMGYNQYPGVNIGAYGEYDSNLGMNIGLEGGYGPLNLKGGYNIDTKSPFVGAGLKFNLQEGGDFTEEDLHNLIKDYGYTDKPDDPNTKEDETYTSQDFVNANYGIVDHLTDEGVKKAREIGDQAKIDIENYLSKLKEKTGFEMSGVDLKELLTKKMKDDKMGMLSNPKYSDWENEAWEHLMKIKENYGADALRWIANNFTDMGIEDAINEHLPWKAKALYKLGKDSPLDTIENIFEMDLDEYRKQYGGDLPKAFLGMDLGGYFRGEQGWIPDFGGKSTTETWNDASGTVQKYADYAAATGIPGISHVGGYTSAAIDYGDAALAYSQGDYEKAAKEFGKGTLTAGLTTVPGGQVAKNLIKGSAKALKATPQITKALTTTSKGFNPLNTTVGDVTKGVVKDLAIKKPGKAAIDSVPDIGGPHGTNEPQLADQVDAISGETQKSDSPSPGGWMSNMWNQVKPEGAPTTQVPLAPDPVAIGPEPAPASSPAVDQISTTPPSDIQAGTEPLPPEEEEVVRYGGDPFAVNPLREFIYGSAQEGKEIPEGWTQEAFEQATKNGFIYNSETGTWSHPTYSDAGSMNFYLQRIKDEYDISGVSEGIGEEGIPDIQKKGTTESGQVSFQGITDEQIKRWQEANQYIISGLKDENGDPLFTEDNPFVATPENVKLVQQGKNDYLDRLRKTDPSINEKYTDDDGNFDQEAYYRDYHGYYGDGKFAIDGKLGEYTISDLGMKKEPAPPPPVVIDPPKEEELDTIEPGDITTTTETERPDFWLQDKIKYTDLVSQKLGLRKYRPWAATFSPETLDATIVDPTRAIGAIQEQAKTAGDSSVYAGSAANRAMKLKAQGVAGKSIADIWAQNQEANLRSIADTNKINTLIKNEANQKNLGIKNALYKDNIQVDKEYDNALRDINNKIANQLANSYTNMANTYNMNSLYPQFDIDPGSGGFVDFTNPQELFANKNVDDRTKTEKLADAIAELKQNNIDPKTLPKEVWNSLLMDSIGGTASNTNTELDEVKQAIMQGGYGTTQPTGVLGGYPGTDQAKHGGEKRKRLAKKGRELRQWFSPLQRGWAD